MDVPVLHKARPWTPAQCSLLPRCSCHRQILRSIGSSPCEWRWHSRRGSGFDERRSRGGTWVVSSRAPAFPSRRTCRTRTRTVTVSHAPTISKQFLIPHNILVRICIIDLKGSCSMECTGSKESLLCPISRRSSPVLRPLNQQLTNRRRHWASDVCFQLKPIINSPARWKKHLGVSNVLTVALAGRLEPTTVRSSVLRTQCTSTYIYIHE